MDGKAETLPLSGEGQLNSFGETNHKKRRLSDFLGETETESIPSSSTNPSGGYPGAMRRTRFNILGIDTGTIDSKQSPFLEMGGSVTSPYSAYPPPPPPIPQRRHSFGSYGVDSHPRRASSATTPPAVPVSPRSFGSRNSSPPRAGSTEFARGHITPPALPFRDDSPLRDGGFSPWTTNPQKSDQLGPNSFTNGYTYRPIKSDQVRLLVLHAGNSNETIHCSLKVMPVRELEGSQLGYHALSYAWGDEVLEKIFLDDVPDVPDNLNREPYELSPMSEQHERLPKEFYIRSNLHAALMRLRCEDKDIWFWIDAICINQNDKIEKSHQLPKMLDIYSNAFSVCIWLGEIEPVTRPDGAGDDPLDFVSVIVNLKLLDRIVNGQMAEDMVASFVAFANLLKRPWFRRRWVIQEVAASTRAFVQCGEKKVNWIDFADAVQLFLVNIERIRTIYDRSELSKWNPDALGHVESVGAGAIVRAASSVLRKSEEGKIVARLWDIESLVVTFLHFEASDTRDTIYALHSLANDMDLYLQNPPSFDNSFDLPKQDYTKPTVQVYTAFIQHCIKSSGSLDIICRHWALPPTDEFILGLPSWVGVVTDSPFGPSPNATGRLNGDSLVGRPGHKIYNASRGLRPLVRFYVPDVPQFFYARSLSNTSSAIRRHRCPYCSTTFRRLHNLRSHLLTHSQEKPYECQECQVQFRHLYGSYGLKRHMMLHTGNRPHRCKHCGRNFARGDALSRHQKGKICPGRESNSDSVLEDGVVRSDNMDPTKDIHQTNNEAWTDNAAQNDNITRNDSISQTDNTARTNDSTHADNSVQKDNITRNDDISPTDNTTGIKGSAKADNIAQTYNTDRSDNMDGVEYTVDAENSQGSGIRSSSIPHMGEQSKLQGAAESSTNPQNILTLPKLSTRSILAPKEGTGNELVWITPIGPNITLFAKGFRLCRITQVSSRVVDGIISHDCLKMAGWDRHVDINDIPDRLWRTLVADRTDKGSNAPSWWRRACMYCLSKTSPDGDLNTSKLIANRSFPETVLEYLKRIQAIVWNRKFFACQDSRDEATRMFGLGSRHIWEGDWCCILFGCSVPVVLREDENSFFKFVGECYVYGMMDGEALAIMNDRCVSETEFPIR